MTIVEPSFSWRQKLGIWWPLEFSC